jgi:hypothetical protein
MSIVQLRQAIQILEKKVKQWVNKK